MADQSVREETRALAGRVMESLSGGPRTAWELKMQLKSSHTRLHLALGWLLGEGKVELRAEDQTFAVVPSRAPSPADTGAPAPASPESQTASAA